MLISIKKRAKHEIRGETTIKYQCTGERNHLMKYFKDAILLSFVYISGQKIVYLLQMYIILKVLISKVYFFLNYILFYVFTFCCPFFLSFIDKPLVLCVKNIRVYSQISQTRQQHILKYHHILRSVKVSPIDTTLEISGPYNQKQFKAILEDL